MTRRCEKRKEQTNFGVFANHHYQEIICLMQITNVFMEITMRENMLQSGEDVQFYVMTD